ncbi:MAG: PorT family protein [Prevotella sp.]|nr:PorT family protein [Prevotella sp.]
MKKIMMIAAMMLLSVGAFAQNEVGQFTLKPMAGINLATMTKLDNTTMRVGLTAGVEAEYGVAENFSLSLGALYSMQGVKSKEGSVIFDFPGVGIIGFKGKQTIKLDYINLPILANYYLFPGFAIKAGIQPEFCVSKKLKTKGTANVGSSTMDVDSDDKIEDGVKGFALSIPFGLSYEYQGFVLDARYNLGVTKAFKDGDPKNSWFMFTLGYKFAL